jgi:hypothetical protein
MWSVDEYKWLTLEELKKMEDVDMYLEDLLKSGVFGK